MADRVGWVGEFELARSLVSLAVFAVVATLPGVASAGPWFEGRAGAGLASGHFEFEKEYVSMTTGEPAVAHDEGGPLGVALGLGAVGGYGLNRQFGLGLTGRVEIAPYIEDVNPRYASIDLHTLAAIGSTFAFRPARSIELRIAPEWAFADFAGSIQEIGAEDNVFQFETMSGPGLGFSFGYCSEPGFGFATATNMVFLSGESTSFSLVTFTLLANWSTW
jgi:hypothetical protein